MALLFVYSFRVSFRYMVSFASVYLPIRHGYKQERAFLCDVWAEGPAYRSLQALWSMISLVSISIYDTMVLGHPGLAWAMEDVETQRESSELYAVSGYARAERRVHGRFE